MSIRTRILLLLIPVIVILLSILMFISFDTSKDTVLSLISNEAQELAENGVMDFDSFFEGSEKVAEGIATSVKILDKLTEEKVLYIIRENLAINPKIFGSTVSFIPKATELGRYAPYYYQTPEGIKYRGLENTTYDYVTQEWYLRPLKEKTGVWSNAYFDEGGGDVLMTTYSTPVYQDNKIVGVSTVDISIDSIVNKVRSIKVHGKGYAFIITDQGQIIAHPKLGVLSKETLDEIIKKTGNEKYKILKKAISKIRGDHIEIIDPFYNTQSIILNTRIKATGWNLVVIYPRDEFLKPLLQLKDNIIVISAFAVGIMIIFVLWLSSTLTAPIIRLVEQTKLYSEGEWSKRLDETHGVKEIKELSRAFNAMGQAIIDQIENVKNTTAQKERYQKELQIAAEIQQSILPRVFPPFPEFINEIDLYGTTKPAREIGGDFYDFFKISEDCIAFVAADVSDKGAPSSFFMAMARMLIRETAGSGLPPTEVLRRANYMLAIDNPHCMFVTVIFGVFNVHTGYTKLVSAGHNPPMLITKEGEVREIILKTNLPLGIMENTHYKAEELTLAPDETLILYTDGVTEAFNVQDEQFGVERFRAILSAHAQTTSIDICADILDQVEAFSSGNEQHDDITLLSLKRKADTHKANLKEKFDQTICLTVPAQTNMLEKITNITAGVAKDLGFDEKGINKIILALDEIVTNVIMHAYPENSTESLSVEIIPRTDGVRIAIIDYGIPFNFDEKLNAYDSEDVSVDQSVGGIGLYLAKESVDEIWYEPDRLEGNKVIFIKYLNSTL